MSAPPSSGVQTTYLVKLGPDGQWTWRNTPPAKFTADWYTKFPPESTPRFLVDLGPDYESLGTSTQSEPWPWKVVHVQNLYLDDFGGAEMLLKQGWGTLSYQWGEFLPTKPYKHRPVWPSREEVNLPKPYIPPNASVEMIRAYNWGIPKLEVRIPVLGVKRAMKALNVRFVWWDAACIPQRDYSGGFSKDEKREGRPFPGPPWLPGDLGDIAGQEVDKQKFVYQKAAVGGVWLNQITWSTASNLEKVLSKTPAIINVDAVRTMLNREINGELAKDNRQAGAVLASVLTSLTKSGPDLTSDKATPKEWWTAIEGFRNSLREIRKEEGWFRSLWSFQEGRLLKKQAFIDAEGKELDIGGKPYDEQGNPVNFPYTRYKMDDDDYQTVNLPSIKELSAFVTLLATQISIAYTKAYGQGVGYPITALVDLWRDLTPVKDNNGNDTNGKRFLEMVMQDLTGTGILFNSDEAPLELILAARRTKFPSLFYRDEYLAMTGVLDLIKYDDNKRDYSLKEPTNGQGYWNDEDKNKKWLYEDLPKAMFQALVKRFQWHCLMFAKRTVDDVYSWGAISMGHYETINCYCAQLMVKNELGIERKDWGFVLPQLEYLPASDEVKMTPPAGSLGGISIAGSTVVKSGPAFGIVCYAVTDTWRDKWSPEPAANAQPIPTAQPPEMMIWTLGDKATPYVDDEYIKGGWAQEITGRTQKPSNPVLSLPVICNNLMKSTYTAPQSMAGKLKPSDRQANPWLLIPFESLNFDLVTSTSVNPGITRINPPATQQNKQPATNQADQTPDEPKYKLNQRCLLITDVRVAGGGPTKEEPHFKATFRGIVDCINITARPSYFSDIRLKWQPGEPPKPEPAKDTETAQKDNKPATKDTQLPNGVPDPKDYEKLKIPPPPKQPEVTKYEEPKPYPLVTLY